MHVARSINHRHFGRVSAIRPIPKTRSHGVNGYLFTVGGCQPDIEDDSADNKYRCKLLPGTFPEKLTPAIKAIQHRDRKRQIKGVGDWRLYGKEKAEIQQENCPQRKVFDCRPFRMRVLFLKPQYQHSHRLKDSRHSQEDTKWNQPWLVAHKSHPCRCVRVPLCSRQ